MHSGNCFENHPTRLVVGMVIFGVVPSCCSVMLFHGVVPWCRSGGVVPRESRATVVEPLGRAIVSSHHVEPGGRAIRDCCACCCWDRAPGSTFRSGGSMWRVSLAYLQAARVLARHAQVSGRWGMDWQSVLWLTITTTGPTRFIVDRAIDNRWIGVRDESGCRWD